MIFFIRTTFKTAPYLTMWKFVVISTLKGGARFLKLYRFSCVSLKG